LACIASGVKRGNQGRAQHATRTAAQRSIANIALAEARSSARTGDAAPSLEIKTGVAENVAGYLSVAVTPVDERSIPKNRDAA
jgi:hypothetical protein